MRMLHSNNACAATLLIRPSIEKIPFVSGQDFLIFSPKQGHILDNDLSATMLRYLRLQEQKQQVETQAKTLDTEMQRLKGQMVAKLDGSCMAMGEYGGTQYTISYNPVSRTGITKDNLQKLKLLHPDIYDEYVTVSESRRFSIKAKSADEAA